jgi:hypothetical protein
LLENISRIHENKEDFMKNRRGLMICLMLALALTLLMWGPGWAQNQGGPGKGPAGQGNQLCTGGPGGTCVVNPANTPNTPNTQNCPGYGAGKSQRQRGPKGQWGAGGGNQPNTQANPAATSR